MDLNVFTEIQGFVVIYGIQSLSIVFSLGGKVFLVSDSVYYQFCDLGFGFSHPPLDASLSRLCAAIALKHKCYAQCHYIGLSRLRISVLWLEAHSPTSQGATTPWRLQANNPGELVISRV